MIELPKRSDSIYKEIETFENYEFTNCIAYEMAIRTNSFFSNTIKGVSYFNNLYLANKEKLENSPRNITHDGEDFKLTKEQSYILQLRSFTMSISNILYEIGICRNSINDIFKIKEIENFKLIKELKKYKELKEIDNTHYGDEVYCDYKKGFSISQLQGDIDSPLNNIINADWKRPRLHYIEGRHAEIELNLNLPIEELIAYISKIKDEYDNDNSIVKAPLELLGENLEKSNDKHIQKKPKAEKYADWFYVYDCYKILKADDKKKSNEKVFADIDGKLFEYYDSKPDSNSLKYHYYSFENYKLIMKNMKYLIDKLGYKELITGVKNN